ncbi:alpha/beta fold hydrolase [Streptomyces sp. NPDC059247]|uniref:alpha/beta hydrolase n=1 Tax=Streptomyces sp. NPDC059247 TaxID=3346790 RepID=UPI003688EF34
MRSRRIASVVAISAVAALVPALTPAVASANAPAATISPRTAAAASLADFTGQKPRWKRCNPQDPAAYQCATIKVPLDYTRPNGRTLDIAISRVKATSARDRRGVLLLNPGGPGGSGLDMPLYMGSELPDSVKKQYDLIGFDPRGVAQSSPVSCGLTAEEGNWQRPYKAEKFAADVAWARTVAEKCRAKSGAVLPHLTTRNTARDMDVIRAVLGEKKISYLGYSYGTYLGAVYTQLFPRRADRFVLDSAVDPARIWRGMIQVWAEGAEPAFTRWTGWTAERHTTYGLGATPAAVRQTFWDLVARADREPIDVEGTLLNGDDIRSMRAAFFSPEWAADLVMQLKRAAEKGTPVTAPLRPAAAPARAASAYAVTVPEDNMYASFWSVVCADTRAWPRDPEQYRRDAIRDKARYPLYGDFVSNIMPCAFWQQGAEPATKVDNKVGALILQNEWDSQTPLVSGQGLRRVMKGARMATVLDGQGHGVYGTKSCADAYATSYLTTGRLPASDVTCRTVPQPVRNDLRAPVAPVLPIPQDRF